MAECSACPKQEEKMSDSRELELNVICFPCLKESQELEWPARGIVQEQYIVKLFRSLQKYLSETNKQTKQNLNYQSIELFLRIPATFVFPSLLSHSY